MKTNTILLGPIGAGKNWCTRTLLAEYPDHEGRVRKGVGKQVFDIELEPGWEATNGNLTCGMGFHVKQHLPYNAPPEQYREWLEYIATKSAADIREMKLPPAIKQPYTTALFGLLDITNDFVCDRCNESFGPISAWDRDRKFTGWGEDKVLIVNGLTGLTTIGTHFAAGPKPTLTWPEIDCVGHHVEHFINLCASIHASFILVAHWAREPREIEGGSGITVSTIGNKLAPRILVPFDEVIVCRRDADKYTWNMVDVDNMHVDQKARRLPYKANINPSFTEIFGDSK